MNCNFFILIVVEFRVALYSALEVHSHRLHTMAKHLHLDRATTLTSSQVKMKTTQMASSFVRPSGFLQFCIQLLIVFQFIRIGVALGVIATLMHHIPDDVFLIAARELAASVKDEDLESGSLYPPLDAIREVSLRIAIGITKYAYCKGMTIIKFLCVVYSNIATHTFAPVS